MAKSIGTNIALDGEKEFRNAIKSIKTDMTVLGSEMKKVSSEFIDNKNSVEALTAKGKVLEKQLESQTNKVDILKKAMSSSADQYGENDKKTKEWQIQLNNAEADLNKLNSEIGENKDAMQKAINPTDDLGKEIKQMGDNADKAGGHALNMGDIIKANLTSAAVIGGIKALGSAFVALGKQAFGAVQGVVDNASAISDNSKKAGVSAEEYQKWTYAAGLAGVEQEKLTALMVKQQTSLAKATAGSKDLTLTVEEQKLAAINLEKAQDALNEAIKKHGKNSIEAREAGIKLEQLQKKSTETSNTQSEAYKKLGINIKNLSSGEAFNQVLAKLAEMKDETERNSIANDIFGKSYADLAPLLGEGAAGMDKLKQEAEDLGGVMSDETVEAGDKLGDTMDEIKTILAGVTATVVSELMPEFQNMADWVVDNKDEIKKLATDTFQKISDVIGFISENGDVLTVVLGTMLAGFVALKVIDTVNIAMGAFNLVLSLNPIGAVVLALAGLALGIIAIIKNWDDVTAAIKKAWDWLTKWNKTDVDDKNAAIARSMPSSKTGTKGGMTNGTSNSNNGRGGGSGFAVGTRYLPMDMMAMVHEGEMIVPKSENPYANSGGRIMPTGGVTLNNPQFIINNDMDIERVANELAYLTQRKLGGGGLA